MKYPRLLVRQDTSHTKPWRVLSADTGAVIAAFYDHGHALGYAVNLIAKFSR